MTTSKLPTFEVDKEGLAKLMSRRGPAFALLELLQNAFDEASTRVDVTLTPMHAGRCRLRVEDDNPAGFADLSHAYRLFAESAKKADPTKRGRFNLGEKLVIAICDEAEVSTTTGTVRFADGGRTMHPRTKRERGSVFEGVIRMNRAQYDAACAEVRCVMPPAGIETRFNGALLAVREPLRTFETVLATEIGDAEGNLKRSWRKAPVAVSAPLPGETATIYEMGIPVVATGDAWHVNVGQKVPLNIDRDNVTPAYLRDLRRAVLDACHDLVTAEGAGEKWIDDAMEDEKVSPEAVTAAIHARYGEKVVVADPSDPEANKIAASQGFHVLHARSLSRNAWTQVRSAGVVLPAGQVTPSPKPYGSAIEGETRTVLAEDKWTDGMRCVAAMSQRLADRLLGVRLEVELVNDQRLRNFTATYGRSGGGVGHMEFNVVTLGKRWFERPPTDEAVLRLIIHELGHESCGDHLDRAYLDALCILGAKLARLALAEPAALSVTPADYRPQSALGLQVAAL